jgi:hypothetical protein
MFNYSRKVVCTQCSGVNFWKGNPAPDDVLSCRYCGSLITTYDDYIKSFIRAEAARMLAQFMETDSEEDLSAIRADLARPRPARQPRPRSLFRRWYTKTR